MSWLFSRALVEASSAVISSDGEPSAPLNATPTPQAYSSRDKTTAHWRRFPSGMTCAPLTADHGEAVLMSYLAGFPVRTLAPLAKEQASTAPDPVSGEKWRGSLAKYDRDSSSWRTLQCSLLAGLDEFSATWPRWGTMQNGECSGLATPVRLTSETGYGSSERWPTPRKCSAMAATMTQESAWANRFPNLETVMGRRLWPTPRKSIAMNQTMSENLAGRRRGNLEEAVALKIFWPTPDTCAGGTGPSQAARKSPRLQDVVKWATPCARDGKEQTLSSALAVMHADLSKSRQLPRQMSAESPELHGGRLNPMWVEWLMGWPLGWTDLRPLATDKFQQWCDSHGAL